MCKINKYHDKGGKNEQKKESPRRREKRKQISRESPVGRQ
jgi:hypothetical protein